RRGRGSGALVTAGGGPLATKRLAYVGPELSYLMYAARWFPFHEYAADRATSDITITVPAGYIVAGASEEPVAELSGSQFLPAVGAGFARPAPACPAPPHPRGLPS